MVGRDKFFLYSIYFELIRVRNLNFLWDEKTLNWKKSSLGPEFESGSSALRADTLTNRWAKLVI